MPNSDFAATPERCYYAVIFSSKRYSDNDGYSEMAGRMVELAETQPGYLGVESARGEDGFGITVSYWRDEASIAAWKSNAEHRMAQDRGQKNWYAHYELRVAHVERSYGMPTKQPS